jgi:hypothetical protein
VTASGSWAGRVKRLRMLTTLPWPPDGAPHVGFALEIRLELAYVLGLGTVQGETYRSDGYNIICFFSVLSTA